MHSLNTEEENYGERRAKTKIPKPLASMQLEPPQKNDSSDDNDKTAKSPLFQEKKDMLRDQRAKRLSDIWKKGLKELESIMEYITELGKHLKEFNECTLEEKHYNAGVAGAYTHTRTLKGTMKSVFDKLRGNKTHLRSIAIIASIGVRERLENYIRLLDERKIDVNQDALKNIIEEVKVEMANVKLPVFDVKQDEIDQE